MGLVATTETVKKSTHLGRFFFVISSLASLSSSWLILSSVCLLRELPLPREQLAPQELQAQLELPELLEFLLLVKALQPALQPFSLSNYLEK